MLKWLKNVLSSNREKLLNTLQEGITDAVFAAALADF